MCFSQKSVKFLLLKQIHQPEDVFEVDTVVGHYWFCQPKYPPKYPTTGVTSSHSWACSLI